MSFSLDEHWRSLLYHSAVVVGLVFAAYLFFVSEAQKGSAAYDIAAYYTFDLANPYAHANVGDLGAFLYSPPIALLLAPFHALPWLTFVTRCYMVLFDCIAWLGRSRLLTGLIFPRVIIASNQVYSHLPL